MDNLPKYLAQANRVTALMAERQKLAHHTSIRVPVIEAAIRTQEAALIDMQAELASLRADLAREQGRSVELEAIDAELASLLPGAPTPPVATAPQVAPAANECWYVNASRRPKSYDAIRIPVMKLDKGGYVEVHQVRSSDSAVVKVTRMKASTVLETCSRTKAEADANVQEPYKKRVDSVLGLGNRYYKQFGSDIPRALDVEILSAMGASPMSPTNIEAGVVRLGNLQPKSSEAPEGFPEGAIGGLLRSKPSLYIRTGSEKKGVYAPTALGLDLLTNWRKHLAKTAAPKPPETTITATPKDALNTPVPAMQFVNAPIGFITEGIFKQFRDADDRLDTMTEQQKEELFRPILAHTEVGKVIIVCTIKDRGPNMGNYWFDMNDMKVQSESSLRAYSSTSASLKTGAVIRHVMKYIDNAFLEMHYKDRNSMRKDDLFWKVQNGRVVSMNFLEYGNQKVAMHGHKRF